MNRKSFVHLAFSAILALLMFGSVAIGNICAAAPKTENATFAAGCFWSMQAIFQQLKGVISVQPGYAGGTVTNPSYDDVETGTTGHAESIDIVFDPNMISYSTLVKVLLTARDPTTLNQQGPDQGTQYRSEIFYRDATQKRVAEELIQKINGEHVWSSPIVTTVNPFTNFYKAEDYHFNYYNLHPDEPYCQSVIAPEIDHFRSMYRALLKS